MPPQEDIRGLKALIHIPYPLYYYVIGAVLAVAFAVLLVWLARTFFRKTKAPEPPPPPEPLDRRILKELADLRDRYAYEPATEKKFHFDLSEIVRRYLEGRFSFAATDRTTEEIVARLPRLSPLPDGQRESLVRILKGTDEVKFAERRKSREEAHDWLHLAEEFVRATTPAEGERQ